MKRLLTYSIAIALFLTFSCQKEHAPDCFTANGADVSDIRNLGSFNSIELNSNMDLTIFSGTEFKVEVIGGENILDKIATSVESGTLMIENNNRCNFVRGYKRRVRINVTVPYITRVTNNAVGTVVFDANYQQDSIIYLGAGSSGDMYINGKYGIIVTSSHGNGDLYFNGTAKQLQVYTNGTNYTRAENLDVSGYIYISTYSIGDTYLKLNSKNVVDCYIEDDGNIYYTGDPVMINILSDGSAKGRLIKQ